MSTKIAILHGGPADRVQVVVDAFQPTIYWAINSPITIPPTHTRAQLDRVEVYKAVYQQVMTPINPGRDCRYARQTYGALIPDQEVALYVYVGEAA
jgi:hypothetical protein